MECVKIVLAFSAACIGILGLFNFLNMKIWMNIMLFLLSINNMIFAFENHREKKKAEVVLYLVIAFFMIFVAIYTLPF